ENSIHVQNLNVSYDGRNVVQNVSFSFQTGKLIGIIGPNGAGKSSLMKAVLGLIPRDSGTVKINGQALQKIHQQIAYVPQRNTIDWDFPITVRDTVLLGTYPKLKLFRRPGAAEKEWSMQCLERVGMEGFSNRQISEL